MTAKETIRAKLFKLRLRARQTGQVRLPASAVALWTEAGIHFLLSAVLSGAPLFPGGLPGLRRFFKKSPGRLGSRATNQSESFCSCGLLLQWK